MEIIVKEENYISVVLVVHNDAQILIERLNLLDRALASRFMHYEIIVVDNFSRDDTGSLLRASDLSLSIVTLARWHNTQSALTAGVELSIGDYIVEIPSIGVNADYNHIGKLYDTCREGNDFVFLVPKKTRTTSRVFYNLMNRHYKGQTSEQFVSSLMTLSSRRGQNKTVDVGTRIVNRNVTYVLTGLKCATVESSAESKARRSLRESFDLMTDTLIFHTDYISSLAYLIAFVFFGVCALVIAYSIVMYIVISTAPGWASTFIFIGLGFGALFSLLAIICKYLSSLIKLQLPKNYTFSSVEKKER